MEDSLFVVICCPLGSCITQESFTLSNTNVFIRRVSFKERGIKLIEEKVKPAFKKIHDYYLDVSKDNTD